MWSLLGPGETVSHKGPLTSGGSKSGGRTMWEQHVKWRGCGTQSSYLAQSEGSWRAAWRWQMMTEQSSHTIWRGAGSGQVHMEENSEDR